MTTWARGAALGCLDCREEEPHCCPFLWADVLREPRRSIVLDHVRRELSVSWGDGTTTHSETQKRHAATLVSSATSPSEALVRHAGISEVPGRHAPASSEREGESYAADAAGPNQQEHTRSDSREGEPQAEALAFRSARTREGIEHGRR